MKTIVYLNFIISLIFTLCYAYQFFFIFVGLFAKPKVFKTDKQHRFAIIISARNEETVIGQLIDSIKSQDYPAELLDTYVIADNCTDATAQVARSAGAIVHERFNMEQVGKGYALDWMFGIIRRNYAEREYDGYMIFDADNLLDPNFVKEMNKTFSAGYRIVTSYRNSKNYDSNWISAGSSLWFLREAKYVNNARMALGTSCSISGTGFLIDADIIWKNGGWIHHLLTEDIEFTVDSVIQGVTIGYCPSAILYDEQPTQFRQFCTQRLRWAQGFYQVFTHYGVRLLKGILKGIFRGPKNFKAMFSASFSCFDMLMTVMPAVLLTLVSALLNAISIPISIMNNSAEVQSLVLSFFQTIVNFYGLFFILGAITVITEWNQIHCKNRWKVIWNLFTFPFLMITYAPISFLALFTKAEWKPIQHSVSRTVEDICNDQDHVS